MTREELLQIDKLKNDNPDFKYFFEKAEQEYQYSFSRMSHHIRNDLSLLVGPFQMLEHFHPEVRSCTHWDTCNRSIEHIRTFLDQVEYYYSPCDFQMQTINLEQMLRDFISYTQYTYHASLVSVALDECCPRWETCGDVNRLYEALELLLQNSFEAITADDKKITFSLSKSENFYRITISDNGKGISADMEETLFEPFCTDKLHHSGLGLPMANRIILAHNGYIRLLRTDSGGTCMEVCLPIKSEHEHLIQQTN